MTPRAANIAVRIGRGDTVASIATSLGVTPTAIYATLKRHDIPLPGRKRPTKPLDPHAPRPEWSRPSLALVELARTIRTEIMAAWRPDA